jgi:hypothetical protein
VHLRKIGTICGSHHMNVAFERRMPTASQHTCYSRRCHFPHGHFQPNTKIGNVEIVLSVKLSRCVYRLPPGEQPGDESQSSSDKLSGPVRVGGSDWLKIFSVRGEVSTTSKVLVALNSCTDGSLHTEQESSGISTSYSSSWVMWCVSGQLI